MTSLIPGLVGKKMSASDPKSKIDLLDDEETVQTPHLVIPHPGLKERDFVQKSLLELNSKL